MKRLKIQKKPVNYHSISTKLYQNDSDDKTKKIQYLNNLIEISKLSYAHVYEKDYIAPIDKIQEIDKIVNTDKTNSQLLLQEFMYSTMWYALKIIMSTTNIRFGSLHEHILSSYKFFKTYIKKKEYLPLIYNIVFETLKTKNKKDKNNLDVGFPEYLAEQSALPSPEVFKYFQSNKEPILGPILKPEEFNKMGEEFANYRTKNIHLLFALLQIQEKPGYIQVIEILSDFLYKSFVYSMIRYVTSRIYHYGFYVLKKLIYIFYTKWFG
jgi:hypothetical protein